MSDEPAKFPVVLSTWSFGMPANEVAWAILSTGGVAIDAVEAGVTSCEEDASVDSVGWGGLPDASREGTLDASIIDHQGRCGAVACLHRVRNTLTVGRPVGQKKPHAIPVGGPATLLA